MPPQRDRAPASAARRAADRAEASDSPTERAIARVHDAGRAKEDRPVPDPLPMGDYRPIRHLSEPTEVTPMDDSTAG